MKIFQFTSSALMLLLATAALAPVASAASAPALASSSVSSPSTQLISQTPPVLMIGDTGTAVGDLQNNLAILGYFSGNLTSYFGSATQDAVKNFQRDAGQLVDGVVGPSTDEAIRQRVGSSSDVPIRGALRLNDSGDQVLELQRRLANLGWFSGPETGFFGSQTEAAVIRYQQARGITADGIVGGETADALRAGT